jgi:type I restriction enzyme, R subunit
MLGQSERETQNRVIALFRDELGYRHLGDWTDRAGNSNIEEGLLSTWLTNRGYSEAQIAMALYRLRTEADNPSRTLYANNQAVYSLLRYGVPVKIEAGKVTETVHLINWSAPEANDFAIAEEVTLKGHARTASGDPMLVLYVNGIAIGTLELKNSRVSIGDGIRQSLSNQQPEFNAWFFSTVQFVFAGNDSRGAAIRHHRHAGEVFPRLEGGRGGRQPLQAGQVSAQDVREAALIELMHDFVLFDGGIKKLPRAHQYFGVKAAQSHVRAAPGRDHLAHPGQRQEHRHGAAGAWILENNPTPAWPSSPTATSWTNRSSGSSPRPANPSIAPAAAAI